MKINDKKGVFQNNTQKVQDIIIISLIYLYLFLPCCVFLMLFILGSFSGQEIYSISLCLSLPSVHGLLQCTIQYRLPLFILTLKFQCMLCSLIEFKKLGFCMKLHLYKTTFVELLALLLSTNWFSSNLFKLLCLSFLNLKMGRRLL